MTGVLNFIKNRISERSTWAGIGLFAGAVAASLGEHMSLYGALLAGVAAVMTPTSGGKK
jgi:hypothetical protein